MVPLSLPNKTIYLPFGAIKLNEDEDANVRESFDFCRIINPVDGWRILLGMEKGHAKTYPTKRMVCRSL